MVIGLLLHGAQCSSSPQLLFTLILLHQVRPSTPVPHDVSCIDVLDGLQLRSVERLLGSLRFLWILILHWTITSSLVLMFTVIPESRLQFVGPSGWMIGMIILLTRLRPSSFSAQLGSITISDMQFTYLLAFQLVVSGSSWSGWIQALCGVVSGILQQRDPIAIFMRPSPAWIIGASTFLNRNTVKPSSAHISPFISAVAPR
jgi:hypothetical protein